MIRTTLTIAKSLIVSAIVLAVAAVALLLWWILGSDSPEEVSLDAAVAQLQERAEDPSDADLPAAAEDTNASTDSAPVDGQEEQTTTRDNNAADESTDVTAGDAGSVASEPGGIAGTWTVDTTLGEFNYEEATGSFVGFRVEEELTFGSVTAVGRTGKITGTIELSENALTAAEVTVDMASITTDRSQRDNPVRRALRTNEFPQAKFRLTEVVPLPPEAVSGEAFEIEAVGDLTVAGVTNSVTFDLQAQLVGDAADVVVVVGSSDVVFADYGVQTPTAAIVVSAEDHGIIELQLLLTR